MTPRHIERIEGRGLPLRGHDIDTDRIIPARFLRAVRFEGLEAHVFEDDRAMRPAGHGAHPFSDPAYQGAAILVVNRNFGCGSSREHAPQALYRWGIRAIVGESYSEIFFGNAVALGLPCVSVSPDAAALLQDAIAQEPDAPLVVDLHAMTVTTGGRALPATLPGPARDAFLSGAWDATGLLLDGFEEVEAVARRLPYVAAFS
jgi:3-isopropylmalate/(R)-2-methylmalate dehydratase small subunit